MNAFATLCLVILVGIGGFFVFRAVNADHEAEQNKDEPIMCIIGESHNC